MPVTSLCCPHCEQHVQVNVTSVTRSRECPNCGKLIMLQLTLKDSRAKRKALLMPVATEAEVLEEGETVVPRSLSTGNIRQRMLHDPEVQENVRKMIWGAAIAAAIITLLVLANQSQWWDARKHKPGDLTTKEEEHNLQTLPEESPETAARIRIRTGQDALTPAVELPTRSTALSTDRESAKNAVKAFLLAGDVESRLRLVRDAKMMESKIRAYYKTHPDGPIGFERIEDDDSPNPNKQFLTFKIILPNGTSRAAYVGKGRDGSFFVDWASMVAYSEMSLSEFTGRRPVSPVTMRLLAEPGDRFGGGFVDASQFVCLKLTDPNEPTALPVFAYATRNTLVARATEFILRDSGGKPVPILLALRFPSPLEANSLDQVWIQEVIAEGWLARGL
ncbi:MAG: hypothetical protein ACOYMN_25970 [Roseimicrobium sp.]